MSATTQAWQPGVLAGVPPVGRFLVFEARLGADPRPSLVRLRDALSIERAVVGLGAPLVKGLGASVPGLRAFPALVGPGCSFPSTQGSVWVFVSGQNETDVHDGARTAREALGDVFALREEVAGFRYRDGRDLTGYLDGTANPHAEKAIEAAILTGAGPGLDGSSFVAVQRFVHDLEGFRKVPAPGRDDIVGRRISDNEEMPDAPASSHVKRTEQEHFEPSGFMVRQSMPWGGLTESGLYFVAYGESLGRFERSLERMAGLEDGIVDALLGYTRATSGGYYWCPPVAGAEIDLSALGL